MSTPVISACARCATLQKTCCQRAEVLVTLGDRVRIAEATGRRDFCEHRAASDPAFTDQPDDPNWVAYAFEPDGTRPILRRRENGDCTFLTPAGCGLPTEIRPLVCRLYPYDYTENGIRGVAAEYCPGAVIPEGKTVLQVLDMKHVDAIRWHHMLYTELRTKEVFDESRHHVRFAS